MHFGRRLGHFDPIIFLAKHHTLSITMTHTTIFGGLMMTITAGFRQDGFAPDKAGKNATSSWEYNVDAVIDMNQKSQSTIG